jgi:hypothetical protein
VPQRPADSEMYPWYDSVWLTRYRSATTLIERVRPDVLPAFVDAFRIFHTRRDFKVRLLDRIFDDATMAEIRRTIRALRPHNLELHEARRFGASSSTIMRPLPPCTSGSSHWSARS